MTEFETGVVAANGIRFSYIQAGDGPLVLCLHGFPDSPRGFRRQVDTLARAGYWVVAPYQRGYAPTGRPGDGNYQTACLALDAVALIDALGGAPAVVFGHDWGAVAAYGAAVLAPDKISRLITAAVPHGAGFAQALLGSYDQLRRSWYMFFFQHPFSEAAVAASDFAFIDRLWADWSPGWRCEPEEMERLKEIFREPGVLEAALAYYRCALDPERHDPGLADAQQRVALSPIEVPTLVLHGANDGCVGVELLAGMEAYFPRGLRIEIVPNAGHFVHLERPDVVNSVVLDYLR